MNVIANSKFGPIIVNVNDQYIAQEILRKGTWAEHDQIVMAKLIRHILRTKSAVKAYDVGANIGIHSLFLSKEFSNSIQIRAFEAQHPVFQMLCGTVAINNLFNVECVFCAVSDTCGETMTLELPDYASTNNFGGFELLPIARTDNHHMVMSSRRQTVQTVTIDSFQDEVDFIKIDIEGMELAALRGACETISRCRPYVFCELRKSDRLAIFHQFEFMNYKILQNDSDGIFIPAESDSNVLTLCKCGFQELQR